MTPRDALTGKHREGLIAHAQIAPKDLKLLTCRMLLPSRLAPVVDIQVVQNIKSSPPRNNAVYRVPEIPDEQRCVSLWSIRIRGRVNHMLEISRPSVYRRYVCALF